MSESEIRNNVSEPIFVREIKLKMPLMDRRKPGKKKFSKKVSVKTENQPNAETIKKEGDEEENKMTKMLKRKMKIFDGEKGDWKKKIKLSIDSSSKEGVPGDSAPKEVKKAKKKQKHNKKKPKPSVPTDPIEEFYTLWEAAATDPSNETYKQPLPPNVLDVETRSDGISEIDYIANEVGGSLAEKCSDCRGPGAPLLATISYGAIRCLQLRKALIPNKLGKCMSLKLFSKHMKIEEQKKQLQSPQVAAVFGTPARIRALVESGELNLDLDNKLFLDWTHKDCKERRLCQQEEWRSDLFALLLNLVSTGKLKNLYLT